MLDIVTLGRALAAARRHAGLSQATLAARAGVSRGTVVALENGAAAELGVVKVGRLLAVVGLTLRIGPENAGRPTLEDLAREAESEDAP